MSVWLWTTLDVNAVSSVCAACKTIWCQGHENGEIAMLPPPLQHERVVEAQAPS